MDISCQEARLLFKLREVRRLRGIYNTYKSLFCKNRTPEEQNFWDMAEYQLLANIGFLLEIIEKGIYPNYGEDPAKNIEEAVLPAEGKLVEAPKTIWGYDNNYNPVMVSITNIKNQ